MNGGARRPRARRAVVSLPSVVPRAPENLSALPLRDLLARIEDRAGRLARREVELARVELRQNAVAELGSAKALGAAGLLGWSAATLLLAAGAMALALAVSAWAACLIVSGATVLAASLLAAIGWRRRARRPLVETRGALAEQVRWLRQRLSR